MLRSLVLAAMLIGAGTALAQTPPREYIYGAELMSAAEREEYRRELSKAQDREARTRLRERHRERLQERARQRGVTLDTQGLVERKDGK